MQIFKFKVYRHIWLVKTYPVLVSLTHSSRSVYKKRCLRLYPLSHTSTTNPSRISWRLYGTHGFNDSMHLSWCKLTKPLFKPVKCCLYVTLSTSPLLSMTALLHWDLSLTPDRKLLERRRASCSETLSWWSGGVWFHSSWEKSIIINPWAWMNIYEVYMQGEMILNSVSHATRGWFSSLCLTAYTGELWSAMNKSIDRLINKWPRCL